MKKTILSLSLFALSFSGMSQTTMDSLDIKKDSSITKSFQYRIKIERVIDKISSEDLKPDLKEFFKADPTFQELISEFVFVSAEDVEYSELNNLLRNGYHQISSFKKIELIKQ